MFFLPGFLFEDEGGREWIMLVRGIRGAVQCGFKPFLALHFAVRFS